MSGVPFSNKEQKNDDKTDEVSKIPNLKKRIEAESAFINKNQDEVSLNDNNDISSLLAAAAVVPISPKSTG